MSPHASADLFVAVVAETYNRPFSAAVKILWPRMVARSLVRAPPVAHAPERAVATVVHAPGRAVTTKAQAEQREAAQNRGVISEVSRMAVGTPALVGGQHVMIRPGNEPSCICRSLCRIGSGDMAFVLLFCEQTTGVC